ncbi:hypothetical protein [Caulobacter sp. 602-1]|uniref:hypothetical protein n=1 Tax=Caulobacter sp. 602-1 TaxID=2492472 RepID=UPI000F631C24|nr:hypothetical protein [Caulobacter sp. 602-1]RRN64139.1 hypothetical protein EIK80_15410 [Caulobacter sp. 602-1]
MAQGYLRRAVRRAPEVAKIRLVAAVAFLTADDFETTFALLKPMSADPNGGAAGQVALGHDGEVSRNTVAAYGATRSDR